MFTMIALTFSAQSTYINCQKLIPRRYRPAPEDNVGESKNYNPVGLR